MTKEIIMYSAGIVLSVFGLICIGMYLGWQANKACHKRGLLGDEA